MHLSRTRTESLPGVLGASSTLLTRPATVEPSGGRSPAARSCCVCGVVFHPRRPEARACSGKCRMAASRGRRVAELVARIEAAELRLAEAERGLGEARLALGGLRELATVGASKVMP